MAISTPAPAVLGRQDFFAGVVDFYFVAHRGRVCLGDLRADSGVIEERARASDERPLTVYHLLDVLLRQTLLF